jgi:hypothetical protein
MAAVPALALVDSFESSMTAAAAERGNEAQVSGKVVGELAIRGRLANQ